MFSNRQVRVWNQCGDAPVGAGSMKEIGPRLRRRRYSRQTQNAYGLRHSGEHHLPMGLQSVDQLVVGRFACGAVKKDIEYYQPGMVLLELPQQLRVVGA